MFYQNVQNLIKGFKMTTISDYKKEFIIDGHKIANNKYFLLAILSFVTILIGLTIKLFYQTLTSPEISMWAKFECIFGIFLILVLPIYCMYKVKQKKSNIQTP